MAFKYKDLMTSVEPPGGAGDPQPWLACAKNTERPRPKCRETTRCVTEATAPPCPDNTYCGTSIGQAWEDDNKKALAADLALLKEQLRQALSQGL